MPTHQKKVDQDLQLYLSNTFIDNKQRRMLGMLIGAAGIGIMAMFFLPNPFMQSLIFVLCGGIVFAVGLLLVKAVSVVNEDGGDGDKDQLPEMD